MGKSTLFWHEPWLEGGKLSSRFSRLFSLSVNMQVSVADSRCERMVYGSGFGSGGGVSSNGRRRCLIIFKQL